LYSRRLVAIYRLTYSPQKISCKPLFEPVFIKHSNYYNQLDITSKSHLWEDLDFWHPIPNTKYCADWAHMLVNMLLPGDWIYSGYAELFLNPIPKPSITGGVKAGPLRTLNLDLPDEWNPSTEE
jgi:hypothetical protein